jgi:ATP-binding cassette subfamily B multidrug efflux pump
MNHILKLISFVRPYWKRALLALVLLTSLVFMDLSIPRLIQSIIDQGIARHDQSVVIHTALLMLGISALSTLFAIGNNILTEFHSTAATTGEHVQLHPGSTGRGRASV